MKREERTISDMPVERRPVNRAVAVVGEPRVDAAAAEGVSTRRSDGIAKHMLKTRGDSDK
jgi:hypothetical protein